MQTIIDYIKSKSLTDTSMAMAHKMIMENVSAQETCILALFQSLYEANQQLAQRLVDLDRRKSPKVITINKID